VLETHRPQERNKVQAFNDFLVFGTMAIVVLVRPTAGELRLVGRQHGGVSPVLLGLAVLSLSSFARRRTKLRAVDEFPEPSI
jgi:hypothetical protein